MGLPLLCLPFLAAIEVCNSMENKERVLFSFTSKRSKLLLKRSVRKNRQTICVTFTSPFEIAIEDCIVSGVYKPRNIKFKYHEIGGAQMAVALRKGNKIRLIHSEPNINIAKSMMTHFADAFNNPQVDLRIFNHGDCPISRLKLVEDLQLPIASVDYWAEFGPKTTIEVLKHCKTVKKFTISNICPYNFQYSPPTPDEFKIGEFRVFGNTQWVKLEDFMECREIRLDYLPRAQANVSPDNLNAFFKTFADTECRLERVSLKYGEHIDFRRMVHGLGEWEYIGLPVEVEGKCGKRIRITKKRDEWFPEIIVEVI